MELTLPILQIVGYQNSGKTTLLTKMIDALSKQGARIGTIKHHGHGGIPDVNDHHKDTEKHRQAGAIATAVEGEGMLQLIALNPGGWTLPDMVSFYEKLPIDILLIEGFKKEAFPKIVILKSDEDTHLLNHLKNIRAVICWYKPLPKIEGLPTFHIDDVNAYLEWTRSYFEGKGRLD